MKSYIVHIQGVAKSHDDAWKAAIASLEVLRSNAKKALQKTNVNGCQDITPYQKPS